VNLLYKLAAILLIAFAARACSSTNDAKAPAPSAASTPASLVGTEWTLRDVAGTPALATPQATIQFPEAGRVAGNGSCNRFTGSVEISGLNLKFGPLASTRMACMDNGVSDQEAHYLQALGAATRYALENGDLLIYCDGYDKPLRFSRAAPGKP
jgi:heat shock protein HslJ